MPSLFVIQGADQGRRYEIRGRTTPLGRDPGSAIRLHDNEVSRKHAEVRLGEDATFRIADLGSANGTFVNGRPVDSIVLRSGDQVRIGRTILLFSEGPGSADRDLTARVELPAKGSDDRSAILKSIPASDGSRVLEAPGSAGDWLKSRLANLQVMYQTIQAVSHILDLDELLGRVLGLVFDSVEADRAAILLLDEKGDLVPKVARMRDAGEVDPDERMTISRSIVEHVQQTGEGVISSDAPADRRFGAAQSIVDYGIREAICVPVQGRHSTLGVIYADVRASTEFVTEGPERGRPKGRFSNEHLTLTAAIGYQAGLAVESTRFYQAKIQAERLAAVGQTIATLSHHIKNILQGVKGGSYLIEMGLNDHDEAIIRRGWGIVEKNQTKIYNLVMDMLSFSKEREPSYEIADLNETVGDVVELMASRAAELGVALDFRPGSDVAEFRFDPEGIHRAVLNIVTNALDAAEGAPGARVDVSTEPGPEGTTAQITVADNGPGIAPEDLGGIFELFASTKGARGTGLGLPVSRKIVREHGGDIRVRSEVGRGATFTLELPLRVAEPHAEDGFGTMS